VSVEVAEDILISSLTEFEKLLSDPELMEVFFTRWGRSSFRSQ
jgi:hypothetical protein